MDIAGISNNNALISQTRLTMEKEEAVTESFGRALNDAVQSKDDAALMNACKEFESYFISVMFKQMRKTTSFGQTSMPKSQSEQTFQEMLDDEYANAASDNGSFGLATFMYKQMKRAYGVQKTV